MRMPREIMTLKSALDELLEAHEEFDAAAFYGEASDLHGAQMKVDAARRRARLVSGRFEHAISEYSALERMLDEPERGDLERKTRLSEE